MSLFSGSRASRGLSVLALSSAFWPEELLCFADAERALLEDAAPGPPTAKVLKNVARRVQKELEIMFKQRNCTDVLRFEPKLKDRALLDLKGTQVVPDTSVPTSTPKPTAAT